MTSDDIPVLKTYSTLKRLFALVIYFLWAEKKRALISLILILLCHILLGFVHIKTPLSHENQMAFSMLLTFVLMPLALQSLDDDKNDGTYEWLCSEGFGNEYYLFARFLTLFISFSLPILCLHFLIFYIHNIVIVCYVAFVLNHLYSALGLIILYHIFNSLHHVTTAISLTLFIPLMIPSFLYALSMVAADTMVPIYALMGLTVMQCGVCMFVFMYFSSVER
jgi:hypothetical protein